MSSVTQNGMNIAKIFIIYVFNIAVSAAYGHGVPRYSVSYR